MLIKLFSFTAKLLILSLILFIRRILLPQTLIKFFKKEEEMKTEKRCIKLVKWEYQNLWKKKRSSSF